MGHDVCILEAKLFPRTHVGICLSDESDSLLDYIGVKAAMEQCAFYKRETTLVKWEHDEPVLTAQPGYHADRGQFDQVLLQNAISSGVKVIQPARVKNLLPFGTGWKISYESAGKQEELTARFVVDASGSGHILPGKRIKTAPSLFAMHAVCCFKKMPDHDGFIEAAKDSWLWFARLNEQEALVTLFAEPKRFLKSGTQQIETYYLETLRHYSLLRPYELDHIKGQVEGCEAGSRFSADPVGLNFIRVGDTNVKIDPVSSQGVHLAMLSGLQAAVVVNTIIKKPADSLCAIDFYRSRQKERIEQYSKKTASVYKQVSKYSTNHFWQSRSLYGNEEMPVPEAVADMPVESEPVQLSENICIKSVPVMKDDFITGLPALHHPSLKRPVTYLSGHEIVPLLFDIRPGKQAGDIISDWSPKLSPDLSVEIFSWLWKRGIIVTHKNCAD